MASADISFPEKRIGSPPQLAMDKVILEENWTEPFSPACLDSVFKEEDIRESKEGTNFVCACVLSSPCDVLSSEDVTCASSISAPYFFCNFCDYQVESRRNLLEHLASRHLFSCQLCQFVALSRALLIQHQLEMHTNFEEIKPVQHAKILRIDISHLVQFFKDRDLVWVVKEDITEHVTEAAEVEFSYTLETDGRPALSFSPQQLDSPGRVDYDDGLEATYVMDTGPDKAQTEVEKCTKQDRKDKSGVTKKLCNGYRKRRNTDSAFIGSVKEARSSLSDSHAVGCSSLPDQSKLKEKSEDPHDMPHFLDKTPESSASENTVLEEKQRETSRCVERKPTSADQPAASDTKPSLMWHLLHRNHTKPVSSESAVVQSLPSAQMQAEKEDRSRSPGLTLPSGDKLQKQLEEAVSSSPGFSFLESTVGSNDKVKVHCDTLKGQSSVSMKDNSPVGQGQNLSKKRDKKIPRDNFLLPSSSPMSEDDDEQEEGHVWTASAAHGSRTRSGDRGKTDKTTEGGYDLLRQLLLERSEVKSTTEQNCGIFTEPVQVSSDEEEVEKQTSSKDAEGMACPQDSIDFKRASNMTLLELLTTTISQTSTLQPGLQNEEKRQEPHSILFNCGYCNFESSNSALFQGHVDKCKQEHHSRASAQHSHSGNFTASKMLMGLSNQVFKNSGREKLGLLQQKLPCGQREAPSSTSKLVPETVSPRPSASALLSAQNNSSILLKDNNLEYSDDEENLEQNKDFSSNSESDPEYVPGKKLVKKKNRQRLIRQRRAEIGDNSQTGGKKPDWLVCAHCSFASPEIKAMRDHLLKQHTSSPSFAKVYHVRIPTLMFFCRGKNSACSFYSTRPMDIFAHIRSCFKHSLDGCVEDPSAESATVAFASSFLSVEVIARSLVPTGKMFFCLHCDFYTIKLSLMKTHSFSSRWHTNVIGFLVIDSQQVVGSVVVHCLPCESQLAVAQWRRHCCRLTPKCKHNSKATALSESPVDWPIMKEKGKNSELGAAPEGIDSQQLQQEAVGKESFVKLEPVDQPSDHEDQSVCASAKLPQPHPVKIEAVEAKEHEEKDQGRVESASTVSGQTNCHHSLLQHLLKLPTSAKEKRLTQAPAPRSRSETPHSNAARITGTTGVSERNTSYSNILGALLQQSERFHKDHKLGTGSPVRTSLKSKRNSKCVDRDGMASAAEAGAGSAHERRVIDRSQGHASNNGPHASRLSASMMDIPDPPSQGGASSPPPSVPRPPQLPFLPPLSPSPSPPPSQPQQPQQQQPAPFTNLLRDLLTQHENTKK